MKIRKENLLVLVYGLAFLYMSLQGQDECQAKSVYAISDHHAQHVSAYRIESDQIEYQVTTDNLTGYNYGPVDLTLDPDSKTIFVTYENAPNMELIDAITMKARETLVCAPGASNFAGITYDRNEGKLYAVERNSAKLFVYRWHASAQQLELFEGSPLTLEGMGSTAYGLALDDDTLYVSDGTETVRYYETGTWSLQGSRTLSRDVAGITVDPNNLQHPSYLYAGALYKGQGQGHNYLIRHNLEAPDDPNATVEHDIGTVPIGIGVDRITGLLYVTTPNLPADKNEVHVYDYLQSPPQLKNVAQVPHGESGPAGICVPPDNTGYRPPLLPLGVDDGLDPNVPECADVDAQFTYTICYGGDPDSAQSNVILTAYLPNGVDFVSADPCNVGDGYDETKHAFVWSIGTIPMAEPNDCSTILTVKVNDRADPLGELTGMVVIENDDVYTRRMINTSVCERGGSIIFVNPNAEYDAGCMGDICWEFGKATGLSWEDAYRDLQPALERAAKMTPPVEIWVAEGDYIPDYSDTDISFVIPVDVSVYGGFSGNEAIRTARSSDPNLCVLDGGLCLGPAKKIVTFEPYASEALLDGFTITAGEIGIYGENTFDANDVTRPTIRNCVVKLNTKSGVSCVNYGDVLLDECTIEDNMEYGVKVADDAYVELYDCTVKDNTLGGVDCDSASVDIVDSTIKGNTGNGVSGSIAYFFAQNSGIKGNTDDGFYLEVSDLEMEGCLVESNTGDGMELTGASDLFVQHTRIRRNTYHGVNIGENVLDTKVCNCWIHDNGWDGLYFNGASRDPIVRNNTIAYNGQYGVYRLAGRRPAITNCILWGNDAAGDDIQLYDCSATYSCIYDPCGPSGTGNINSDPCFAAADTTFGNFHLDPNSLCRDAGDPNVIVLGETDIDNEDRIEGVSVDMGADEIHDCNDVGPYHMAHPWDWNADGVLNLHEFRDLSAVWLTTSTDPNWIAHCDICADNEIDMLDMQAFVEDWLWQACWYDSAQESGQVLMMMGMEMMGMEMGLYPRPLPETSATEITLPQLSIDAQLATIAECITWAQEALDENPSDEKWQDIVANLWELFYTLAEQQ